MRLRILVAFSPCAYVTYLFFLHAQTHMLRYVSFPTQTLFKCFKMVPVMLMGKVIGNKAYPSYDYAVAIMIG